MRLINTSQSLKAAVSPAEYDAILIVGFGGPERREDVLPFLENVTRGRGVPRERLLAVAEHYYHFGGASPINAQVRELIAAIEPELRSARDQPAYLLGQSKLAPDARRSRRPDERRRREASPSNRAGCV